VAELRIGTSGWSYRHWRGVLYPPGLPARRWIERYAQCFDSVEVNATFYRQPRASVIAHWLEVTPADFAFAVKMPRFITHLQRLDPTPEWVARFEATARAFGPKLGPVLVQLPPTLPFEPERVGRFLARLHRDRRYALEARHPSWLRPLVFELLARHRVAWCIADSGGHWPRAEVVTSDFVYLRFHGPGGATPAYAPGALRDVALRIRRWRRRGLDVYAYFNNDAEGHAVRNAGVLAEMLGAAPHARHHDEPRTRDLFGPSPG